MKERCLKYLTTKIAKSTKKKSGRMDNQISGKMIRITACLLGMICLGGTLGAVPVEYEINLVRNAGFQPGEFQSPADWTYFAQATNILEAGRGRLAFMENGIVIEGQADLMQFDMWDDVTPAYKFSCRMKTEGGKGAYVAMRIRNRNSGGSRDTSLVNRELDVWEDLAVAVQPESHYGFCIKIHVPRGVKLSVRGLKIAATLQPDAAGRILIGDQDQYIPARGIRLPSAPNWAEKYAAHELRVNAYLATGAVLPVFAGREAAGGQGWLRIANLKKTIPDQPVCPAPGVAPEANGFRIVCGGGNLDLTGGNDAGVLAGALYLSELCGVKFYAPKFFTVKKKRELKIPAMDIARQPAFEWTTGPLDQHQTFSAWKYGYIHPDSTVAPSEKADAAAVGWVHPPLFLAPPYLYATNHPEYYALVKGRRVVDGPNRQLEQSWGYLNLCLGNPDLQKVAAERIGRLMDMYPHTKYFSIAQGDGTGWCECDMCTALDAGDKSWSDRLLSYANAVAALLQEKYPDRKLLIFAYGAKTEDLPLKTRLHPNVAIGYATWPSSWPIWEATDCPQNQRGMRLLDDWNAFTGTNLTLFLYPVNTYENAEKLKLAAAKGIRGFHHCGLRGDFPEVTLYTTGRLIWEPDADLEAMIDEIMPLLYGGAAPLMREYFDMHHELVRQCVADPSMWRVYREVNLHKFRRMPMAYAGRALDLLTRAEAAAGGYDLALMKIHMEKYKVLYAYVNEFNAVHPAIPDDLFEDYALKLAELVKLARKCREPYAGWRMPFSEWLYQTTGVLDFDRGPYTWYNDKKIDAFLANPVQILRTRVYLQQEVEDGIELPAKAWLGSKCYEKYQGHPAAVLRRRSSPESRVRAYFQLDRLPAGDVKLELQGLDNEKTEAAEIEITINGQKIFAGPVEYPKNTWGVETYAVPAGILQPGENIIAIANTMGDYKTVAGGEAGPAAEAMAAQYNWGWCMVGRVRLIWNAK